MAAHGKIHLTKQVDDFVAGDPELACHVVYAKLAQTILLAGSNRTRSMPLFRGGLGNSWRSSSFDWICVGSSGLSQEKSDGDAD